MGEVKLEKVQPFNLKELEKENNYLVIQNVDGIPPHIGLVVKNKYYSTSVSGVKTGLEIEALLKNIQQKNIPAILIKLNDFSIPEAFIQSIFENYGLLDHSDKSCLFPIITILNHALNIDLKGEFVFEMVPELQELNLTEEIYSFNLSSSSEFVFKKYSREEIGNCIAQLNEKAES